MLTQCNNYSVVNEPPTPTHRETNEQSDAPDVDPFTLIERPLMRALCNLVRMRWGTFDIQVCTSQPPGVNVQGIASHKATIVHPFVALS